ncbi:hypothetical protein DSCA_59710 [Desulfosarcina alkanivorans]|uniref:Uncharacterized protein n=1 Tax=Desulfosarcina alkanivorans TaxID=571177 RepID=A0A5K7YY48_9BACT|nr:hypothetical protein DSCA_59710 [Desulfosarcina alkanivorans]
MAACGLGEVVFLTFNPECALLKKSIGNLYERYAGHYLIQSSGFRNIYECSPPLAVRPMFLYLNKKHAALVPRIAKTLKEMKADGTLKAIRSKTLSHFDLHREAGPQHYPGGTGRKTPFSGHAVQRAVFQLCADPSGRPAPQESVSINLTR